MPAWVSAGFAFFVYVMVAALTLPRLALRRRAIAIAAAAFGLLLLAIDIAFARHSILHQWLLPPMVLLVAYWSTGSLFVAAMPRVERILAGFDAAIGARHIAARTPRAIAELLEFAYAAVYPIIPIALGIIVLTHASPDVDRFWSVILITDFVCFGMLPWIQTRPPRALEGDAPPWPAAFRAFNLRLLGATSIRVNTFPSGHAAEALSAALLVIGSPWPWTAWMFFNAAAISAGTVFGRYHYALDAIAGWLVALVVWLLI
jgi:hypothetical protein